MTPFDRRALLQLVALVGAAAPLSACASGDSTLAMSDVGRAPAGSPVRSTLERFAAGLLDQMPAGNVVVSPVSIAAVLAMLGNGAAGTTRTQIESVLGSPIDALNTELNTLTQRLVALDGAEGTSLALSNALWVQKGMTWKQPFLDALKKWYGAGGQLTDFIHDAAGAIMAINSWCSTATKGLIPSIVDESLITPDTRLAVGNAVYVKGAWEVQFDKSMTSREPFTTGSGSVVSVDMMHATRTVKARETDRAVTIALPFRHADLAFVAAVPKIGETASLSRVDLTSVLDEAPVETMIALPKFHAEFSQPLKKALVALGLVDAWSALSADFSAMTGDRSLSLGFVQHKAVITVDESGAEAAAVTVGGVVASSARLMPKFVADHPFLWAIVHVPSRSLVILGREDDPTR